MIYLNPPASGGTGLPIFTQGSIVFADPAGILTEDNSNLFYDDTNNFKGIGVNAALNGRLHVVGASDTVGNAMYVSNLSNLTQFRVRNLGSTIQDAYTSIILNTNQPDATVLYVQSTIANSPRFNFYASGRLQFSGAGFIGTILPTVNNALFLTNPASSSGIILGYSSNGVYGGDSAENAVSIGDASTYSGTGNTNIWSLAINGTFNQTGGAAGTSAGVRIASTLTSIVTSYTGFDFEPTVTTVANLYGVRIRPAVSRSSFSMTAAPTAKVHIGAGTTSANTAPLKITLGGALLATEEPGAIEAIDAHLYWTDSTGTRFQIDQQTAGSGADAALSNLAGVAINTTLVSDTHNTDALGTAAIGWSDLFLGTGAVINFEAGDVVLTHSAGILTMGTGDLRVTNAGSNTASVVTVGGSQTLTSKTLTSAKITTNLGPTTNDGAALGDTTHNFSDLFLATGSLINIENGNWIATHSSGILTVSTGDLRVTTAGSNTASVVTVGGAQNLTSKVLTSATITTNVGPTTDDGAALGDTTHNFSDLFLATGSLINYANGNVILTHSSGILTMGTGELRITTPGTNSASVPTLGSTSTFTNKRWTERVVTAADDSTAVIDVDVTDQYQLTAMANATTISTTGTPTAGQQIIIRLKDNGTPRALTWDSVFRAIGVTLPTTTVTSKTHYIKVVYNLTDTKWDALAVGAEA